MTGKLKVIRMLGNPRAKKKKRARKKPMRRISKKRAAAAKAKGNTIVRAIVPHAGGHRYVYWGGSKWTTGHNFAKRFHGAPRGAQLARMKRALPAGWIALDALPA